MPKSPTTPGPDEALVKDISYPDELPIVAWRDELLDIIGKHQVVIVAGETGSGKSTQLPKLCLELGRGTNGMIGHTQPRRIAARSIAERVAEELGTGVGGLVGFKVRFTDAVDDATLIKVMTDGILLNEIHRDRDLRAYDTIIVDEAHERSLNVDFLLGYLKQLLPRRPDLKVIITSATIDTDRFSEHFDDAPVVEVAGRTYPVEIRYRPLIDPTVPEPRDQSQAICDAVHELSLEGTGDILVFCSGEREIRDAVDACLISGCATPRCCPCSAASRSQSSTASSHRTPDDAWWSPPTSQKHRSRFRACGMSWMRAWRESPGTADARRCSSSPSKRYRRHRPVSEQVAVDGWAQGSAYACMPRTTSRAGPSSPIPRSYEPTSPR